MGVVQKISSKNIAVLKKRVFSHMSFNKIAQSEGLTQQNAEYIWNKQSFYILQAFVSGLNAEEIAKVRGLDINTVDAIIKYFKERKFN